jgi:alpha-N-arabinofuranosidase
VKPLAALFFLVSSLLAQLVNVIAPIFTNKQGLFLQPIYFPIAEYGKQRGNISLDPLVTSPTYQPAGRQPLGYLDVSITHSPKDKALYLNVLNRSLQLDIPTRIDNVEGALLPSVAVWQMTYPNLKATHAFGDDKKVAPRISSITAALERNGFSYTFPKQSLTILKLSLQ